MEGNEMERICYLFEVFMLLFLSVDNHVPLNC
jgi:hypothetical protein